MIAMILAVMTGGATLAQFSDTETSQGNRFFAGIVDLKLDGGDSSVVKFDVESVTPGYSQTGIYRLQNSEESKEAVLLDIDSIFWESKENNCYDAEVESGDTTCGDPGAGEGELQDVLAVDIFFDYSCDGNFDSGERSVFSGFVKDLDSQYVLNESIMSASEKCLAVSFDWTSTGNDNIAQSDSLEMGMSFLLKQAN
jgi:predicted ribosomally synthesized peptide with SipW-like signal peptide